MKRRESLKYITVSALLAGMACNVPLKKETQALPKNLSGFKIHRYEDEMIREKSIQEAGVFFTKPEMETISILCDIIIPKDEKSGSATEAKVPEFIEFTVNDQPHLQTPLRGGLRWLNMQCLKRFEKPFSNCSSQQRIQIIDLIAYPQKAKDNKDLAPGISFFTLIRNLTATGFYTSEIGIKDLGYEGNKPNLWNGVPDDVLKQYGLAYTERELKESVNFG